MSGPSLGLGVTASGIDTVKKLNASLLELKKRLEALPAAAKSVADLQKLMAGGSVGSGNDLKKLAGEVKAAAQQQATALAELAEAIKGGYAKAAAARKVGEEQLRGAAAKGGESGIPAFKAKMMVGAADLVERENSERLKVLSKLQLGSLKIAEGVKAAAESDYSARVGWTAKMQLGSLKIAESLQQASAAEQSAKLAWAAKLQLGSLKIAEASQAAAAKDYSSRIAWAAKMQLGSLKIAEAAAKSAADETAAMQKRALAAEKANATILRLASERYATETKAQAIQNAAFAAKSPASQARAVLGARTQLDAGLPAQQVRSGFGDAALVAAQGTSTKAAYDAVHNSVSKLNGKVDESIPRFRSLSKVMQEGHSAARGLASGFGAMYLTWGSLAPLLAGAALSQSFVQSIKIGATVRQELDTLRVLSNESVLEVKKLEDQLVSLGKSGPFGPREVAEAMKVLSLAGLDAQQVGAALGPALNLALTGGVAIEKASESLVAIGTAYGFQAEQFDRVADVVAKTAAVSMTSVAGMMESFRSASVVGEAYKVTLTDTATALALLANIGVRNSAAGTSVRQMYSELSGATRQTREAMKTLGIEIRNSSGGMRPLVEIIRETDRAFTEFEGKRGKGLSPAGELRAIQEMSNERGAKSFVASLQAFRKKVADEGGLMSTELERINGEILNSFGFTANAAAEMAATPLNQMKSVVSSFQTALYTAFTDLEPTTLKVSANLRTAFASPEFVKSITGLASTVADLTVFLLKHIDAVGMLVLAYATYKAAMVGWTLGQLAFNLVQKLTIKDTVVQTAATTALVFPTIAAAGATGVLTAATGALAVSLRAVGVAGRFALVALGPIGAAMAALGLLWAVFASKSNEANVSEAEGAQLRGTTVIDALDKEYDRLVKLEVQLGKTKSARTAEAKVAAEIAAEERIDALVKELKPLEAVRQRGEDAKLSNPDVALRRRMPTNMKELAILAAVEDGEQAGQKLSAAYDALGKTERTIAQKKERVSEQTRKNYEIEEWIRQEAEAARVKGKNPFETPDPPPTAGKVAAGIISELAAVVAAYNKQEQTLKTKHDQERKALDLQNKYKLISHAEYTTAVEQLAEREAALELANLQKRIDASKPLLDKLRALKNPNPVERQQISDTEGELEQLKNLLASRQQLALIEKAGRANIIDLGLDIELQKLQEAVDVGLERVAIEERRAGMTAAEAAADTARLATESSYLQVLRLKNAELDTTAQRLAVLDAQYIASGGKDAELLERLNAVQRQLDLKIAELNRIKDAQRTQGDRAAEGALADPKNMAPWEQTLRNWQNTRGMMLTLENEFKTGFMDASEKVWISFVKGGTGSMATVRELIKDTLGKITYRKIIAEPLERIMNSLWQVMDGAAAGPTGQPAGTSQRGPASDLAILVQGLLAPFRNLKTGLDAAAEASQGMSSTLEDAANSAPNFLSQIFDAFGAGFAALMRSLALSMAAIPGTGGSGLSSFLASLFGSIGGSAGGSGFSLAGTAGSVNPSTVGMSLAQGAVMSAGARVENFAKGASFTNQIFNSPTLFKFARGGAHGLGQMGEAGPEAVMPLTRGSDGRLGVANHGGGGGQKAPVTNITIIGGPSKPEVSRKKNATGGEDVLVKFKESVKADIAGDIDNGVGLARNISGRFGVNTAAGLVR